MPADLQFDEVTHTYTVGGEVWPSVTEILEPLNRFDGVPAEMLRAAAAFGSNVHSACHMYNQDVLELASLDPALLPYVDAWVAFVLRNHVVVLSSEQRVMHKRLRYCGTMDVLASVDGIQELIEIKSSAEIPRSAGPQTAGYAAAIDEPRIRRRVVLLKPDGTYRSERLTSSNDWTIFLSCLNLHNWRKQRAA